MTCFTGLLHLSTKKSTFLSTLCRVLTSTVCDLDSRESEENSTCVFFFTKLLESRIFIVIMHSTTAFLGPNGHSKQLIGDI